MIRFGIQTAAGYSVWFHLHHLRIALQAAAALRKRGETYHWRVSTPWGTLG